MCMIALGASSTVSGGDTAHQAKTKGAPITEEQVIQTIKEKYDRDLRKKDWGGIDLAEFGEELVTVEPLASEAVTRFLPGCNAFVVDVVNPKSVIAGRVYYQHSVVQKKDGALVFLNTPEEIAQFLADYTNTVLNKDDAHDFVYAYTHLAQVQVVSSHKGVEALCDQKLAIFESYAKEIVKQEKKIKPIKVKQKKKNKHPHFTVTFFALTDPAIGLVYKYTFEITPGIACTITEELASRRSGYK